MKKYVIKFLLICVATFIMCGCKATTSVTNTNGFDEETNQKETFEGISYEVPSNWIAGDNDGNIRFYLADQGGLMVNFTDGTYSGIMEQKEAQDDYFEGLSEGIENFEVHNGEICEIGEYEWYCVDVSGKITGTTLEVHRICFLDIDGSLFSFGIVTNEGGTQYSSEDYLKILESVRILVDSADEIGVIDDLFMIRADDFEYRYRTLLESLFIDTEFEFWKNNTGENGLNSYRYIINPDTKSDLSVFF